VLTYVLAALTPWGRTLDSLSAHGRTGTGWSVFSADLILLETISTGTILLAVIALVVVGGVRGRWRLGLRSTVAVLGAIACAELLKYLLPAMDRWHGTWDWPHAGSFPSGHAVVVTSISLAVLSVSSARWRRLLVGPLVAATAIATTATVTVGWHRPSDVLGSFFLATAWHRAMGVRRPAERRLRAMLPRPSRRATPAEIPVRLAAGPATAWWLGACFLVLGGAAEGVLTHATPGRLAPLAYLGSLAVLLAAALITVVAGPGQVRQPLDVHR
jgi:acid phosphatase family membrane protein YuiD